MMTRNNKIGATMLLLLAVSLMIAGAIFLSQEQFAAVAEILLTIACAVGLTIYLVIAIHLFVDPRP